MAPVTLQSDDYVSFDPTRQCYTTPVERTDGSFQWFPDKAKMEVWEQLQVPESLRNDTGVIEVWAQDEACYCYPVAESDAN